MDNHKGSHKQFIPAEPGWLALFDDDEGDDVGIHAEPVVAWCLEAEEQGLGHLGLSSGHAVIGAGPWIGKAESEKTARFFALVREDQLDADLLQELRTKSHHSRESLMERARKNHDDRVQGHASWVHERRSHRGERTKVPPSKIF